MTKPRSNSEAVAHHPRSTGEAVAHHPRSNSEAVAPNRDRLLIAGIGNIFRGDDGFGVEVAGRLARDASLLRSADGDVMVVDFGINGIDLGYALIDDFDAAILIDTYSAGAPPGTLHVVVPDPPAAPDPARPQLLLSPHELDPVAVLQLVHDAGGRCRSIVLVGVEPGDFGDEFEGAMGLGAAVAAAVPGAIALIERLVAQWRAAMVRGGRNPAQPGNHQQGDPQWTSFQFSA